VPEEQTWPALLANRLREAGIPVEVEIVARTGWTTGELLSALEQRSPAGPYDLVTLQIGVNNQYRGLPEEEYRAQFQQLLQSAIRYTVNDANRVVVLSIPDWSVTPYAADRDHLKIQKELARFNHINREETRSQGGYYVDITPISLFGAQGDEWLADDRLHPSGKMYAAWVEVILPVVHTALGR
jgi:lysophospholipase L1-like esterase